MLPTNFAAPSARPGPANALTAPPKSAADTIPLMNFDFIFHILIGLNIPYNCFKHILVFSLFSKNSNIYH
jgi:hypothetical protein